MDSVRVLWEGPFNLQRIDHYSGLDYTMGVYTILDSGYNRLLRTWGPHRLLYIGKAYDQTFRERLKQHLAGDDVWMWIRRNLRNFATAKIGHVDVLSGDRISFELVSDVESLMINVLKPPANIQSTKGYHGRELEIVDGGKSRPLPSRVSTRDLV